MATDIKWEAPTVGLTSYLTTDLNSQANGNIQVGAGIDNQTNLCTHMDLELKLASVDMSAQTGLAFHIYLLEAVDGGTNFDTNTDNTATASLIPPADKIVAVMAIRAAAGAEAKIGIKSMIPIPPGDFKIGIRNMTGAALAATTNVLSYRTYNLNNV